MRDIELKLAAVERLAALGVTKKPTSTLTAISKAIEVATGKLRPYSQDRTDHVIMFITPQKVDPATPRPFRAMAHTPHPRDAEIDAGQPPMRSMAGYGTIYTRSPGGTLGSR